MKSCSTTKAVFLAWRMNLEEEGEGKGGRREGKGGRGGGREEEEGGKRRREGVTI